MQWVPERYCITRIQRCMFGASCILHWWAFTILKLSIAMAAAHINYSQLFTILSKRYHKIPTDAWCWMKLMSHDMFVLLVCFSDSCHHLQSCIVNAQLALRTSVENHVCMWSIYSVVSRLNFFWSSCYHLLHLCPRFSYSFSFYTRSLRSEFCFKSLSPSLTIGTSDLLNCESLLIMYL